MKLTYKINLVALAVLIFVGAAITATGVKTIRQVTYSLNRQLMTEEVNNIYENFENTLAVLIENQLDKVESYTNQAQSEIIEELENYQYAETGRLFIVTTDGIAVRHDTVTTGQPIDILNIPNTFPEDENCTIFNYNGEKLVFTYKYFKQWDWLILLSVSNEEIFAAQKQFITRVIVILFVTTIFGFLAFVLFLRRVVSPISHLAKATSEVSKGKWDTPLPPVIGKDEVAQLTISFHNMAKKLGEMYGDLEKNLAEVKKSQSALRDNEEKYRSLVELLPLAVFETNIHGQLLFANQNFRDTFRLQPTTQLDTINISTLIHEQDADRLHANVVQIIKKQKVKSNEYTLRRSNDETFPALIIATPRFNNDEVCGLRGILLDITDRKLLEDQLHQAQKFSTSIIDNIADPIFVKNDQHQLILLNDAFLNFSGHSREETLGKTDHDLFPKNEADLFLKNDIEVFASDKAIEHEATITDADGRQHIIITKKTVFTSADGKKVLVGIIKDITERKFMEQELLKNQKLKSISVLAGGIAHDFNNILTAILGNLSLMKVMVDRESKIFKRLTETEKASLQAKELTRQLLTFSHGGAPVKSTVSLTKLINDSVTFTLRGTKVRGTLSSTENIWPVDIDEGQMSRVIHNIVVNAVQAMPDGGELSAQAANLTAGDVNSLPIPPGDYVCVSITDTGTGIPKDIISNIFDPYFTTKDEGSGLGLAIAHSVVQRHNGHLVIESEKGKGTTCKLYLPASTKEAPEHKHAEDALPTGTGTILIMDDEKIIHETVSAMLDFLGYEVDCAFDGEEALSMYQQKLSGDYPYDAVIMDLTIPGGMGGQEAIIKLLQIDPSAKALVSSGYSEDPIMANFMDYGFSGVIEKPFQLPKIATTLEGIIAKKK